MPKVTNPLFSGDARGKFGRLLIFTRGGQVRIYFKPKNPNTAAQQAVRQAFKEFSVPGLTQEQADLLYSAILHLHDDRYSQLAHDHDDQYSQLGHLHDDRYSQLAHLHDDRYSQLTHSHTQKIIIGGHGAGQTIGAGATGILAIFATGFLTIGGNVPMPVSGIISNFYIRIAGTQPASGSLVFTLMVNNVASALVATCAPGGAGVTVSDTTHTVTVSAGDLVYVSVKNNAAAVCAGVGAFNFAVGLNVG